MTNVNVKRSVFMEMPIYERHHKLNHVESFIKTNFWSLWRPSMHELYLKVNLKIFYWCTEIANPKQFWLVNNLRSWL